MQNIVNDIEKNFIWRISLIKLILKSIMAKFLLNNIKSRTMRNWDIILNIGEFSLLISESMPTNKIRPERIFII